MVVSTGAENITFYSDGIKESTSACELPSQLLMTERTEDGFAFYDCRDPAKTSRAIYTTCVDVLSATSKCGTKSACFICSRGLFCGADIYVTTDRSVASYKCNEHGRYHTFYTQPFLQRIPAATEPSSAKPSSASVPTSALDHPGLSPATVTAEATSCPSATPISTHPSSGVMAAIAVPSIFGTLALAGIGFYFVLRSKKSSYSPNNNHIQYVEPGSGFGVALSKKSSRRVMNEMPSPAQMRDRESVVSELPPNSLGEAAETRPLREVRGGSQG